MNFENHPIIPEQSEEHNKLIGTLVDWKNRLGDPHIAQRIQQEEDGAELLKFLNRTRIGSLGEVTVVAYPEDSGYSSEEPPRHLDDEEVAELVTRAAEVFVTAELYSDN